MVYGLPQMFKAVLRSVLDVGGDKGLRLNLYLQLERSRGETHSKTTVFNISTYSLNKTNKKYCAGTMYFDLNYGTELLPYANKLLDLTKFTRFTRD